jgi:L-lactate dehydrogenase complex protein LldG
VADRAEFLESIRHRTRSGKYSPTRAPDVAWTEREGPRESPPIEDPPARFLQELEALGGHGERVATLEEAREYVVALVRDRGAKLLLRWDVEVLQHLGVDGPLEETGVEVAQWRGLEDFREVAARADVGLSSAEWAVAETGSLVLASGPGKGRSVTLLPPTYVAVLPAERVLRTVHEAIEKYASAANAGTLPANVCFHTGPSRSGDIEMEIFVGMHGPGDVHVVLVG